MCRSWIALSTVIIFTVLIFSISSCVYVNASESPRISDQSQPTFNSLVEAISNFRNSSTSQIEFLQQDRILEHGKPISATIDPKTNLVYYVTSVMNNSKRLQNTVSVLNTTSDNIVDSFRVGDSKNDFLKKIIFNNGTNTLYGIGEHRVLQNGSLYEYDSLYKIDPRTHAFKRISLYSEQEEGKEGDLSGIALNPQTNTIYVGSLYPEGGSPGLYIIDGNSLRVISKLNNWEFGISDVLFDPNSHLIYAAAKHDDVISVLNNANVIQKNIKIHGPIKILADIKRSNLYFASADGNVTEINLKNNESSVLQGLNVKDIAFNPSDGMLYLLKVNPQLLKNKGESENDIVSEVIKIDSKSNHLEKLYQTNIKLNNIVVDPSSKKIILFGSDLRSSNTYLYVLKAR